MTKVILTIAGFDPSAGAGIAGDLKTIAALGGYGVAVITALTVQNTLGVSGVEPVSADLVLRQAEALFEDFEVSSVKIGMVPNLSVLAAICRVLEANPKITIVCDPVRVSSGGESLSGDVTSEDLIEKLFPLVDVLTPNLDEAQELTGIRASNAEEMAAAANCLREKIRSAGGLKVPAVLVKGGHLDRPILDVLSSDSGIEMFQGEVIETPGNRGTGCALSSAIATLLAEGKSLTEAIAQGREFVLEAMRRAPGLGRGHRSGGGPLGHLS